MVGGTEAVAYTFCSLSSTETVFPWYQKLRLIASPAASPAQTVGPPQSHMPPVRELPAVRG